jgi:oligoribonuclease
VIIWCDTETTDLDERKGLLLEVAFVVTDDDLKERAFCTWIINHGPRSADITMKLVVREMHEKSGLLHDIDLCLGHPLIEVERRIREWFAETFGDINDLRKIPLAGSTISFDRRWLRHHLPEVERLFSYRSIDVSSITELADRWNKPAYAHRPKQDKHVPHRALDDAKNSIEYLRYYRAAGFINTTNGNWGFLDQAREHLNYFKHRCPFEKCDVCSSSLGERVRGG